MIRGRATGMLRMEILQVIASYQVGGTPELDVIDQNGRLHEGVTMASIGGGDVDLLTVPRAGAEVIAIYDHGGSPYIIGVLAAQSRFVDGVQLNNAGEYSESSIGLRDAALISGEARIIATSAHSGIYLTPRARVQGRLEVSNGASPAQSAAIAETTLEQLDQHHSTIEELRERVQALQEAVSSMAEEFYPTPIAAAVAIPDENERQRLQDLLDEATALPEQTTTATTPPNHDIITSQILKLER